MPNKRKSPAAARWTVHVPTHDEQGNHLHDLSGPAHEWLRAQIPRHIHSIHTEGPYQGGTTPYETNRHLSILGTDIPEVDSYVKQLATHVGDLSNKASVLVTKEGANAPEAWHIHNQNYRPGPARPEAIQFAASILSPSAGINFTPPVIPG